MKLWVRIPIARATGLQGFSEHGAELVKQEINNQIKPWKNAQGMDVAPSESNLWVGFVFSYAGMKGKDVTDLLEAFIHKDGAEEAYKAIKKIMKKHGE
jgi:hypothetical protein